MVAWETMALASFFLVTTEHRIPEIRRAGFLYLLIAHVGAIAILLCFGVLQGGSGDYTFDAMRSIALPGAWPTIAFFLALFGFGAKAGLLPLHVWLPEAHPAAPVARLGADERRDAEDRDLRPAARHVRPARMRQLWWWGVVALALGLVTALFGVIFAAVQTDMKRLLAYSSIENIGIIVAGIGLAILFKAYDKTLLAAITLTAVLYHSLNHAFFKSLLFLATGSVLHATQRAQPRQARRPHPPHAVGRVARARRHARDRRHCRRSTASSPNGCCCRRSCSRRACRSRSSTCWCRSPPPRWCWRRRSPPT